MDRNVKTLLLTLFLFGASYAVQEEIGSYRSARDTYFYNVLYTKGGKTLYCNIDFSNRNGLNVEHVYPASWMKETAGCPGHSRDWCRNHSDAFNFMEADLHNLWPSKSDINSARSNFAFGIIGQDDAKKTYKPEGITEQCDFEVDPDADLCEPRKQSRGEIARSMFYMVHEYGLPLRADDGRLLLKWHKDDPVSSLEKKRNKLIDSLQGTRNPYIDDPSKADALVSRLDADTDVRTCNIKGNISRSGRIFHISGSQHYDRVKIDTNKGERMFCSVEEAIEAGWRAPN